MATQTQSKEGEIVNKFYGDLNEKCNFKTRINSRKLSDRTNAIIDELSEEVLNRYYGSGIVVPEHLESARILDMGSGSGSSVFILSKLVGPKGYVVGVDFCQGLVDTAERESENHYRKWGYSKPNFEFRCANINDVTGLGFEEGSFDAVVSNGVFCLCPDKVKPLTQAYRMLKPGGQFLLSDVYGEVHQPQSIKDQEKMWCLGIGCLVWDELCDIARSVGFTCPYLHQSAPINIKNEEVKKGLGEAKYLCASHRFFKLPAGAKRGPATVTYLGNLEDYPDSFPWDIDLTFKKNEPVEIDAELETILAYTDFAKNFKMEDFTGNVSTGRNQNPFDHLKHLAEKGEEQPFVYDVE